VNSSSRDPLGLILLVEDDPNQVIFVRRALAKVHISNPLRVARNGEEAVTYLANRTNEPPSLVLLDLKVPRIRGLKVLEWMRGQPDLRETPVVVVTSSIEPDDRRRADELGVLAYLCKPVYAEGLLELMETVPWLHLARG
jgi:CheY-like chemotaxis protein